MPFLGVQPADTFAAVAKQTITGDGSTTYTLTHSVASANDLAVFVNNVRQEPTTAYSASGTSITFTEAIASTDSCYVVYIARTFQTLSPPDNSVNADQISYPLTNFSSTGIDDNADSLAITIDSSENVIVGRTDISAAGLGVAAGKNISFSEGSSATYANIYRQNSSGGLMLANGYQYGDGTNGDHSSVGSSFAKTLIGLRNGAIYFYADAAATASVGTQVTPTEIARITTGGLKMASGKGIDFSANSNASGMTSEVLDDYEEGTWTPTYVPSSGSFGSISYGFRAGHYTKIGDLVTVHCRLDTSSMSIGSAGGYLLVGSLPFTAHGSAYQSITVGYCYGYSGVWATSGSTGTGMTSLYLYNTDTRANSESIYPSNLGTGGTNLYVSATYKTT